MKFYQNHLLASRRRKEDRPTWRARSSLASSPRRVPGVPKSWQVTPIFGWLVVWNRNFYLYIYIIYTYMGMSSSQLTLTPWFFRGVFVNHQPVGVGNGYDGYAPLAFCEWVPWWSTSPWNGGNHVFRETIIHQVRVEVYTTNIWYWAPHWTGISWFMATLMYVCREKYGLIVGFLGYRAGQTGISSTTSGSKMLKRFLHSLLVNKMIWIKMYQSLPPYVWIWIDTIWKSCKW